MLLLAGMEAMLDMPSMPAFIDALEGKPEPDNPMPTALLAAAIGNVDNLVVEAGSIPIGYNADLAGRVE